MESISATTAGRWAESARFLQAAIALVCPFTTHPSLLSSVARRWRKDRDPWMATSCHTALGPMQCHWLEASKS
eukprot:6472898-Amphidinium_carterae.1